MKGIKTLKFALLAVLPVLLSIMAARAEERQTLSGHVPAVIANLHPISRLQGAKSLKLTLGLPLRNPKALTALLQQTYDPASPTYHHYLTSEEFTKKFGPTEQDYQAVINFAKTNGLDVVGTHRSRILLDVCGKVQDIEGAFHVTLHTYQHPTEQRQFYAPDVDPSMDPRLSINEISGLSDYAILRPMGHTKQIKRNPFTALGSAPNGYSYIGSDFRNAYAPGVSLDGTGQIVGLVAFDGYYANDIATYEVEAGLTNVPLENVSIDGFSGPDGDVDAISEVSLDIEMAISMAPGLTKVVVFESPNNVSDFLSILDSMADNTQINQFSSSFGYSAGAPNPNTSMDQIFMKMAMQGQSFFQASGDGDAYSNPIQVPAASPYITSVGGTTLTMNGRGTSYASESVWNSGYYVDAGIATPWAGNGDGGYWGSGGGVSAYYAIPYYQQDLNISANQASTTMRNIPDVAMTADSVWGVYNNGSTGNFVGTSCAAPLWAAFMALVNQQSSQYSGSSPVGFINPAVYRIGASNIYASCFHDITSGNNFWPGSPSHYSAVSGYDLATGWGTPAGAALINALAPPDFLQIAPMTGFSSFGGTGGPFSITSEGYTLTNIGTTPLNWSVGFSGDAFLSFSPNPDQFASTSGSLAPGGPPATVTVYLLTAPLGFRGAGGAYALSPGVYNETAWFTNLNTGIFQSRTFTLTVLARPANEQCSSAIDILVTNVDASNPSNVTILITSPTNYSTSQSTTLATASDNPIPSCGPSLGNAVWYTYSLPADGTLIVNTDGGDFDTIVALYEVTNYNDTYCESLEEVACDAAINSGNTFSTVTNFGFAGTVYYILAGGYEGSSGNLALNLSFRTESGPPFIVFQPQNQQVAAGGSAFFSVGASGSAPLSYYWFSNGVPIPGTYFIDEWIYLNNVQPSDSGSQISCLVSNSYGTVLSSNALLTVVPGPLDHFNWTTITSPQKANNPFGVTITACDRVNVPVTSFSGQVALTANAGTVTNTILNGLIPTYSIANAYYAVVEYYSITPNRDLLVTALRYYGGSNIVIWNDSAAPGDQQMLSQEVSGVSGVWQETLLATPLTLQSNSPYDLEIDYPPGTWYAITNLPASFSNGILAGSVLNPLSTPGYYAPVDLRFTVSSPTPVLITPVASATFTKGVWTGNLTVLAPEQGVTLLADDGLGQIGLSNPFDASANTVATASPSFFSPPSLTGNQIMLYWSTTAGQIYQLQYTTDLNQTNWSDIGTTIVATNVFMSASDDITTNSPRFYRVVVLP